jgi:hypothetical protein
MKMKKTLRLAAIFWVDTDILRDSVGRQRKALDGTQAGKQKWQPVCPNLQVIVQYKVTPTEAHHRRVAALGGRLNAKIDFIKGAHYALHSLGGGSGETRRRSGRGVRYARSRDQTTFDNITNGTISASYMKSEG